MINRASVEFLISFWKWWSVNLVQRKMFSLIENRQLSQHRPQAVMPKHNIPCERIFTHWKRQISSTSPPRGDTISNIFSCGLLKIMARAARKLFQYHNRFSSKILIKKARAARKIFQYINRFLINHSYSYSNYLLLLLLILLSGCAK